MLEAQWDRTGIPPGALLDRPELEPELVPHWDAFLTLSARRPQGFSSALAIPISEITHYLNERRIHDEELRLEVMDMVLALDDVWLKHHHEEAERERKKKGAKK